MVAFAFTVAAQEGLRDRDPNLAATQKITSDLQAAGAHSGPFYLISRLQLQDIGYDAHFFVPSDAPKGVRWAINAPQRLYFVPTRKIVASVEVAPSLALSSNLRKTQVGYTSRGDLQFIFNHIWFDGYAILLNDLRAKTGEINSVVTAKESEGGVNGEYKYSSRTSGTFAVTRRKTSYPTNRIQPVDIVDIQLLGRREVNSRVTFKHATFPLTTLTLAGERSTYTFDETSRLDANRNYAAVGAIFDNGPSAARVEVGRLSLVYKDPTQKDYRGTIGNATLTHRFGARTLGTLNLVRDIDFSIYIDNSHYIQDRAGLTLDYDATRRLKLRLLSQHGRDRYLTPVNGVLRQDNLSFDGVGWNYSRRHIQGGFDVGYYDRSSNVAIDASHGIRFLFHLSLNL